MISRAKYKLPDFIAMSGLYIIIILFFQNLRNSYLHDWIIEYILCTIYTLHTTSICTFNDLFNKVGPNLKTFINHL